MAHSSPDQHAQILIEISSTLYRFVKLKKLGTVRVAPFTVFLDQTNIFKPDICFISNQNIHLIQSEGFFGAPDLIIEISSPLDDSFDLNEKKEIYESAGIEEYWIIDSMDKNTIGYKLENEKYQSKYKGKNKLELNTPKLKIKF